jgi:predicted RNA-binding protein with PIN domain
MIDGHNLIPKLGLNLQDADDETQLIDRLQLFCRLKQTQVEIYFDGALPGHPAQRKVGRVVAHFICKGTIADAAIEARLRRLGNAAQNWIVVSSSCPVSCPGGACQGFIQRRVCPAGGGCPGRTIHPV